MSYELNVGSKGLFCCCLLMNLQHCLWWGTLRATNRVPGWSQRVEMTPRRGDKCVQTLPPRPCVALSHPTLPGIDGMLGVANSAVDGYLIVTVPFRLLA